MLTAAQSPKPQLVDVIKAFDERPKQGYFGVKKVYRLDCNEKNEWIAREVTVFERVMEFLVHFFVGEQGLRNWRWNKVIDKLNHETSNDLFQQHRLLIESACKQKWEALGGLDIEKAFSFPQGPLLLEDSPAEEMNASTPQEGPKKEEIEEYFAPDFEKDLLAKQEEQKSVKPHHNQGKKKKHRHRTSAEETPPTTVVTPASDSKVPVIDSVHEPLCLQNYFNSCYLDSVLEMILSQVELRQLVRELPERFARKQKPLEDALKSHLARAASKQDQGTIKRLEDQITECKNKSCVFTEIVKLMDTPKERRRTIAFRMALMKCHEGDFFTYNLRTQLDAADVVTTLFRDIPEMTLQIVNKDTWEGCQQPLVRNDAIEPQLKLPMATSFEEALKKYFSKHPGLDREIDEKTKERKTVDSQYLIEHVSDFLCVKFERFQTNIEKNKTTGEVVVRMKKLHDLIALPQNGIIDLSPYMEKPSETPVKFEMVGYVMHSGEYCIDVIDDHKIECNAGHYTANVKIGSGYFHCNDMRTSARAITRDEFHQKTENTFYQEANTYLVLLRRIR